ncbi:MAG: Carbon storage regulator, partial [uncultured Solirubrobacteraceae bacterium]
AHHHAAPRREDHARRRHRRRGHGGQRFLGSHRDRRPQVSSGLPRGDLDGRQGGERRGGLLAHRSADGSPRRLHPL